MSYLALNERIRIPIQIRTRRDATSPAERVEDSGAQSLVRPGVLATETPVPHYWKGRNKWIRVILDINDAVLRSWEFNSLPFQKDHGLGVDYALGRIRNLRVENRELWGDFHFDPRCKDYYDSVEYGTYEDLSVQFDIYAMQLVEAGTRGQLPLYRATRWRPFECSLVWSGGDPNSGFRRERMDELLELLRAQGMSQDRIDTIMRAAKGDAPVGAGVESGARSAEPEKKPEPPPQPPAESPPVAAMQPEVLAEHLARSLAPYLRPPEAPKQEPEPPPAPKERPIDIAVRGARDLKVPETVIAEATAAADGDAEKFGLACRAYLAANQSVPEIDPRRMEGGHERKYEALADMGACLRARCGVADEADEKRVVRMGVKPREAPVAALVEMATRAWHPSQMVPYNREVMLAQFADDTAVQPLYGHVRLPHMPGSRWVRSAAGGLTPGDMQTVLAEVVNKVLLDSYRREQLPFSKMARKKDVRDRRKAHMKEFDVAGRFEPLVPGENLHSVTIREAGYEFSVEPYGQYVKFEWAFVVDDDMAVLTQMPRRLGDWHAAMHNKAFTQAIVAGRLENDAGVSETIYKDEYDIAVDDVRAFRPLLRQIRSTAAKAIPIGPSPGEDARNDVGRSYSFIPNTMLHSEDLAVDWEAFARPLDVDNRDDARVTYENTIWRNSREGLYVPDEQWHAWPGPSSTNCTFYYGQITGYGLMVQSGRLQPPQQNGIWFAVNSTFGAAPVRPGAFRVRKSQGVQAARGEEKK